jgi:hypothetical protein
MFWITWVSSSNTVCLYATDTTGSVAIINNNVAINADANIGASCCPAPTDWSAPVGHSDTGVVIAYFDTVTNRIELIQHTSTGATGTFTSYVQLVAAINCPMAITSNNLDIGVAAAGDSYFNGYLYVFGSTGLLRSDTISSSTIIEPPVIVARNYTDSGIAKTEFIGFFVESENPSGTNLAYKTRTSSLTVLRSTGAYYTSHSSGANRWHNQRPASAPFVIGDNAFIWMYAGPAYVDSATSLVQGKYVLVRLNDMNSSGSFGNITAGTQRVEGFCCNGDILPPSLLHSKGTYFAPSNVAVDGATSYSLLMRARPVNAVSDDAGMVQYTSPILVEVDHNSKISFINHEGKTYLASGSLKTIEEDWQITTGFILFPEIVAASSSSTGGSLSDGTYYIKATYRSTLQGGSVTESEESTVETVTLTGGTSTQKITLSVTDYVYFQYPRQYKVVLYVSADNVIFYECKNDDRGEISTRDLSHDYDVLDTPTTTRFIYTTGGVLDNQQPGCFTDIAKYNQALYGIDPLAKIWWSKTLTEGNEPAFNASLTHQCEDDNGGYYQLANMDNSLWILGVNSVQYINGNGADDLGNNKTLTMPTQVPGSDGIKKNTNVCIGQNGCYYWSAKGPRLLQRDGSIDHLFGQAIDDYKTKTCVGIVRAGDEIRYCTSDGYFLVWNEIYGIWSITETCFSVTDTIVHNNQHILSLSDGTITGEDTSLSTDNIASQGMFVETPWLRLGALNQVQRVCHIALSTEYLAEHDLKVSVFLDNETTAAQTWTQEQTGLTVGEIQDFRFHVGSRCSSIKIRIEDLEQGESTPSITASCKVVSLQINVMLKKGIKRLSMGAGSGSK